MAEQAPMNRPPMPPSAQGGADQAIEETPMFQRKRVLVPLLLAVAVVIAGGWYWYVHNYSFVGTDDAYIDANRLSVSTKIMGRIVKLGADEGDTVKQGDTLIKLDDSDLLPQLAKAEASVRYYTRSSEVSSVNLEKARDDFARSDKQFKGQIVTQEQYNHSQNALKLAEAQADLTQSQIATSQADVNIIKTQLGNTVIIAPFTGVIAKRWVMQGDVVQPGQTVFSMYDYQACMGDRQLRGNQAAGASNRVCGWKYSDRRVSRQSQFFGKVLGSAEPRRHSFRSFRPEMHRELYQGHSARADENLMTKRLRTGGRLFPGFRSRCISLKPVSHAMRQRFRKAFRRFTTSMLRTNGGCLPIS